MRYVRQATIDPAYSTLRTLSRKKYAGNSGTIILSLRRLNKSLGHSRCLIPTHHHPLILSGKHHQMARH